MFQRRLLQILTSALIGYLLGGVNPAGLESIGRGEEYRGAAPPAAVAGGQPPDAPLASPVGRGARCRSAGRRGLLAAVQFLRLTTRTDPLSVTASRGIDPHKGKPGFVP